MDKSRSHNRTQQNDRNKSNPIYNSFGNTTVMKPKLLEGGVSNKKEFFNLSDGFKRVFAQDKKDQKMVIPIVGYGGHRRGDRSQNYFGKSFRETSIQSKAIERNIRSISAC